MGKLLHHRHSLSRGKVVCLTTLSCQPRIREELISSSAPSRPGGASRCSLVTESHSRIPEGALGSFRPLLFLEIRRCLPSWLLYFRLRLRFCFRLRLRFCFRLRLRFHLGAPFSNLARHLLKLQSLKMNRSFRIARDTYPSYKI